MPQYRKLYVKTTESLDINDMPDDFTRLLWVMLPLGLCREGRGIDNAAWIKSKIFPLREDVTNEQITDAMDWYSENGMIERYEVDGRGYFHILSWERYQGNTSKEAESIYPAPPKSSQELVQSKSRVNQEREAADRSASASTSEYESVNASVFNGESPLQILCDVSGLSDFPVDQREWHEVILSLVEDHGADNTRDAMKRAFQRWIKTKSKNGRYYKRTNLGWINWAQEELAGGEIPRASPKTAEEKLDDFRRNLDSQEKIQ